MSTPTANPNSLAPTVELQNMPSLLSPTELEDFKGSRESKEIEAVNTQELLCEEEIEPLVTETESLVLASDTDTDTTGVLITFTGCGDVERDSEAKETKDVDDTNESESEFEETQTAVPDTEEINSIIRRAIMSDILFTYMLPLMAEKGLEAQYREVDGVVEGKEGVGGEWVDLSTGGEKFLEIMVFEDGKDVERCEGEESEDEGEESEGEDEGGFEADNKSEEVERVGESKTVRESESEVEDDIEKEEESGELTFMNEYFLPQAEETGLELRYCVKDGEWIELKSVSSKGVEIFVDILGPWIEEYEGEYKDYRWCWGKDGDRDEDEDEDEDKEGEGEIEEGRDEERGIRGHYGRRS